MKLKVRSQSLFWGIVLLVAAALLILDTFHVFDLQSAGLSVWRIILAVLCLAWFVAKLIRLRFQDVFFPLAFLFLLTEDSIARLIGKPGEDLASAWMVLLIALLLTIGVECVRPKKNNVGIGKSDWYFDAADLSDAEVTDVVGNHNVYFTNVEHFPGNGVLHINDVAGQVTVHVPNDWFVTTESSDCVGVVVDLPEQNAPSYDKHLSVVVTDIVGKVNIVHTA